MEEKKETRTWADEVDEELGDPSNQIYYTPPASPGPVDNTSSRERYETTSHFSDPSSDYGDDEWVGSEGKYEVERPEPFNTEITNAPEYDQLDKEDERPRGRATREEMMRRNVEHYVGSKALHNGALLPFRGWQNEVGAATEIHRRDFTAMNGLSRRRRDRSTSSVRVPSPVGQSPARIDYLEAERHRLTKEVKDVWDINDMLSNKNRDLNADNIQLTEDRKWAREEMDTAFTKLKKKVLECAQVTKDRDSWQEQFSKARPYVLQGKERERKLAEDNRDVATQTEETENCDTSTQTEETENRDTSTQTEKTEYCATSTQTEIGVNKDVSTQTNEKIENHLCEWRKLYVKLHAEHEEIEAKHDTLINVLKDEVAEFRRLKCREADADRLAKEIEAFKQEDEQLRQEITRLQAARDRLQAALNARRDESADSNPDAAPQDQRQWIKQDNTLLRENLRLRTQLESQSSRISSLRLTNLTLRESSKKLDDDRQALAKRYDLLKRSLESSEVVQDATGHTATTTRGQREAAPAAATPDLVVVLPAAGDLVSTFWWLLFCLVMLFVLLEVLPTPLNDFWLYCDTLISSS